MLQGTEFRTAEELLEAMVQILSDIPLETLMTRFHQWMERLRYLLMVMENMWNKEVSYFKNFCLSPTGNEMLRGESNTL
jgi:hypothetical protein